MYICTYTFGKHFVFVLRFNDNRSICCRMHSIAYVRQLYGNSTVCSGIENAKQLKLTAQNFHCIYF